MSSQKQNFKIIKASTNYFHLVLLIVASLIILISIYRSHLLTFILQEELRGQFFSSSLLEISARGAFLELSTPKNEYQLADSIKVKILLKNNLKKTQGVDILLKYDPEALSLLTISAEEEDLANGILKIAPLKYLEVQESAFDIFPYFTINKEEGLIGFSALAKPLQEIMGKVEVASLNFKAQKKGEISLDFVFEKGKTDDTNVAFSGKDILEKVKNLKITIR